MATAQQVLDIARGELGYCRWDDQLAGTKYGRWYSQLVGDSYYGTSGVPFCAMFVSWVLNQAGQSCAGFPGAYCPWIVTAGKNANATVATKDAQPGDVVLFDWGPDGVSDHVGFIESNNPGTGYATCLEGNTTGSDGRSGSVARRTRAYSTICCVIRPQYTQSGSNNAPGKLNGIDIASWEKGIDLSKVPCDFVFVKATGGKSYTNPELNNMYNDAVKNGKLTGLYHFACEKNRVGTAAEEADYFIGQIKGKNGMLCLDWEADAVNKGVAWAKEWLDRVASKTGVKPVIYMNKSTARGYDWSSVAGAGYHLWCAQYANNNTQNGYNANPWTDDKGFGAWTNGPVIYQYTENGKLPGYSGSLDLNIFHGDKDYWNYLAVASVPVKEVRRDLAVYDYDDDNAAQQWFMRTVGDGTYALRNVANYEWLSDPYSSTAPNLPGAAMIYGGQGGDDGNADPREPQLLDLEDLGQGIYKIHPHCAPNLSLDVVDASPKSGASVRWWTNNDAKAQRWYMYLDGNKYRIVNVAGMKLLSIAGGTGYK